jgi:hypothetical protein
VAYSNTTVDEEPAEVTVPLSVAVVTDTDVAERMLTLGSNTADRVDPWAVPPVFVILTA